MQKAHNQVYDPVRDEEWWTLAMAVAWIADRNAKSVVRHSPRSPDQKAALLWVMFIEEMGGDRVYWTAAVDLLKAIQSRLVETDTHMVDAAHLALRERPGPIPDEHLGYLILQGDDNIDGIILSTLDGTKFQHTRVRARHILREWPAPILEPGDEIYQIIEQRGGTYSLFDAAVLVGSLGQSFTSRQIANLLIDEKGMEELSQILAYDGIIATGRKGGLRGDIPSSPWEAAKYGSHHTEADTHRIEFLDFTSKSGLGGTLTLHSNLRSKEPDWVDIRVPAEALRAHVASMLSKSDTTPPALAPIEGAASRAPTSDPGKAPARRGRAPKFAWAAFEAEVHQKLRRDGIPDATAGRPQKKLVDEMTQWCWDTWGESNSPEETSIKDKIRNCIAEFASGSEKSEKSENPSEGH
ncbi:hypothetical protein DEM27_28585 [Metarhizobium album]|uniref:Uncharacterized protein n=1 Tax=Metarhizobium album TaxID=2182425 RepID=A0A2U2DHG2_9HYPH|nr:hypothetical protein [Rhizobium album]PWE52765.1 hypothetical protein DEM27_28585 [Rhizobium album]